MATVDANQRHHSQIKEGECIVGIPRVIALVTVACRYADKPMDPLHAMPLAQQQGSYHATKPRKPGKLCRSSRLPDSHELDPGNGNSC